MSTYDLVPPALAVQAMRDNGYRNAAYALAELIDNSVQAGARNVELLCAEQELFVAQRSRRNLHQIAVLDDGCGMDERTLRIALQFGNGTRLNDRSGIGRFGMGLPSASISQCRRVDVWSWRAPGTTLHTYIDLDEITAGTMREVPEPTESEVPDLWKAASNRIGESGTLVVWSKVDRCMWKTGLTVIKNSEFLVGRMYRSFIHQGRVSIRMTAFNHEAPEVAVHEREAVPNDPGYLMAPTSTPAPYDEKPMFEPDGDNNGEQQVTIKMNGEEHTVLVRYSVAKQEARQGRQAGSTKHGKHAANNVGVSLMRAQRELDLDQSLVIAYDPRERWWGVEIDFPPSLDELFGVTNNKQSARNFTDIASTIGDLLSGDDVSTAELRDELEEEQDPRYALVELVDAIDRRLRVLRSQIKVQSAGSERRTRHASAAEMVATKATEDLKQKGHAGQSDIDESRPSDERTQEVADSLREDGLTEDDAHAIAVDAISMGIKYIITEGELEGRAFFTVKPVAGELLVKININHPAYAHLVEALDSDASSLPDDVDQLKERLTKAALGLRLLLLAWARFEDEQPAERRMDLQDIRSDWGRYADRFLRTS